jgi:two-component system chemotaxis response regulator CheB
MRKIKVLIVDDSAVVRSILTEIINSDPLLEVIGTAQDPFAAAKKLSEVVPDVITLDIEMPKMDGLTFLEKLMSQHPIPVIICSSLTGNKSQSALRALELGAVEVITKPQLGTKEFFEESSTIICDIIKAAAQVDTRELKKVKKVEPKLNADVVISKPSSGAMIQTTEKIISIGASTGGTEALQTLLTSLPADCPGIVIVQHMPETFTSAFAKRLDGICRINVKEAKHNDTVIRGQALIAPGNKHMLLKRSGARYYVEVVDGPLVSRHRPSVDVLFRSTAKYAGKNAVGVILTGMGDDGAKGMMEMKDAGAYNIAQDEKTCVVFGMPKEAIKAGGVDLILPLQEISSVMLKKGANSLR